ncbi:MULTISPECIES: response regulator [unclassified Paraburkholderia]|uniref:response regulator n=1 Tax=unclassified Paraburkholderia TaxID=2615204 RepID=UPI002AB60D4B|nr:MULTISPECIES: response regulator [unclassified Paraburkholderia]
MSDLPIHVLFVDDDADLCQLIGKFFRLHGCEFTALHSAVDLTRTIDRIRPTIVVLDLMMPKVDGLAALNRLRAEGTTTPVIMLTARAEDVDRIIGLELGADDYLGKPFMPKELLARIHAVLRHHRHVPRNPAQAARPRNAFGSFELASTGRTLLRDGQPVKIGAREYKLLEILVSRPMEPLSREDIVRLLDGPDSTASERSLYVEILRLRRVVEEDPAQPRFIQTIRGVGYVFVPEQTNDETPI